MRGINPGPSQEQQVSLTTVPVLHPALPLSVLFGPQRFLLFFWEGGGGKVGVT